MAVETQFTTIFRNTERINPKTKALAILNPLSQIYFRILFIEEWCDINVKWIHGNKPGI